MARPTSTRPPSRPSSAKRRSGHPAGRRSPVAPPKKAGAREWIAGARPRTLPVAIAPVALGSAAAYLVSEPGYHWVRALACLALALLLQIGVNYANDYSDGVRGTDANRVGPARLTGSGAARPRTVLTVALVCFALGAAVGLFLVIRSGQWWLLLVGVAAIAAAWFYTGGKRPYGYAGLGEVAVFVFFGVVATAGTQYVQVGTVTVEGWLSSVAVGLLACAVLVANNTRDIEQDRIAGKRTLSARIGSMPSRILFVVLIAVPFVIAAAFALLYPSAWYVLFLLLLAIPAAVIMLTARTPRELILVLQLTTATILVYGLGLGAALVF